jgi:hypothetical protein
LATGLLRRTTVESGDDGQGSTPNHRHHGGALSVVPRRIEREVSAGTQM